MRKKTGITILIMLGTITALFIYYYLYSLTLKEEEKYLTIPYGSMTLGIIILIILIFLNIYNTL